MTSSTIAPYLREIGRGKDGARALSRDQARDLMGLILDGRVGDLELGGFALAMRIKGETPEELAGFLDAVMPRTLPLPAPQGEAAAVLLPSYNGARRLPNLTALLALRLARAGVPVLVHGLVEDPTGRVTTAAVFQALGLPRAADAGDVAGCWARSEPAFMPLETLHPGLARLLGLRRVLGLRNSGHTLAKLLPAVPGAVRVVNHTHPEYASSLSQHLHEAGADAVLMRGTEGEPVADARRQPRMLAWIGGEPAPAHGLQPQEGVLAGLPDLPESLDATPTAAFVRQAMDGARPVPAPIEAQAQALAALARTVAARRLSAATTGGDATRAARS